MVKGRPREAMVGESVNRKHRVNPRALCSCSSEPFLGKQEGLGWSLPNLGATGVMPCSHCCEEKETAARQLGVVATAHWD